VPGGAALFVFPSRTGVGAGVGVTTVPD
jgi:hypothetical protein